MMTKSPWVKRVNFKLQGPGGSSSPGLNPDFTPKGQARSTGRTRSFPSPSGGVPVRGTTISPQEMDADRQAMADLDRTILTLTVRWYALPLRHAQRRWASLRPGVERRRYRGRPPFYIIGVSGFPSRLFRGDPEKMKVVSDHVTSSSFLKMKGREPIQASRSFIPVGRSEVVNVRSEPWLRGGVQVFVLFPRKQDDNQVIALEEKNVEFVTKIGSLELKRKFKLKNMVYNGKLEL